MKTLIRILLCLAIVWSGASSADIGSRLQHSTIDYTVDVDRLSLPAVQADLTREDDPVVNCECSCVGEVMRCEPAGCSTLEGNKCPLKSTDSLNKRTLFRDYVTPLPPRHFERTLR